VLVTAANIGRDHFENNPVVTLTVAEGQLRKINVLDFYHAGSDVRYAFVAGHDFRVKGLSIKGLRVSTVSINKLKKATIPDYL
jgi:hypothetical protein